MRIDFELSRNGKNHYCTSDSFQDVEGQGESQALALLDFLLALVDYVELLLDEDEELSLLTLCR